MTIKIFFVVLLFHAVMTPSNISQERIFHSYTVLLNVVQVDDEFGKKKDVFSTFECCEEVWTFRAAELFKIHQKRILSSCKKRRVGYNRYLNLDARILFCNGHKLKNNNNLFYIN